MKQIHSLLSIPLCIFVLAFGVSNAKASPAAGAPQATPVKAEFKITSALPIAKIWEGLSNNEKNLAFHLQKAGRAGRPLLLFQSHRHAISINEVLEKSLSKEGYKTTVALFGLNAAGFEEYQKYAAQFHENVGPYESSNRKFIMTVAKAEELEKVFGQFAPDLGKEKLAEVLKLMTHPMFELTMAPEKDVSTLLESGGNIYEKQISDEDVEKAVRGGLRIDLNCQVIRDASGNIACLKLTTSTPGIVGETLTAVVKELERALPYALTPHQAKQIQYLIKYFREGSIEDFRSSSIEWVKDAHHSTVDFMMGFIEFTADHRSSVGSWESYIQIVDPKTTELSLSLASNAGYFERQMPYEERFKKVFPPGHKLPALMVYSFQEISNLRMAGYNLPNFDDIRNDPEVGFKNIINHPKPGEKDDPELEKDKVEALAEFVPLDKLKPIQDNLELLNQVHVLLHEIIGHGSGTYDSSKYGANEEPVSALGKFGGSAMEEIRADLAALTFSGDPKLVQVGIYKSQAEADEMHTLHHDYWLYRFISRLASRGSLAQMHTKGNWLLASRLLKVGAIRWVDPKDESATPTLNTQVLRVVDHKLFHETCVALLGEIQKIKATRDQESLNNYWNSEKAEAPLSAAREPWVLSLKDRFQKLQASKSKYEQRWTIDESTMTLTPEGKPTLKSLVKSWIRSN